MSENTYKKWIYSPKEGSKLIEVDAKWKLPKGWYESPADFPVEKPKEDK